MCITSIIIKLGYALMDSSLCSPLLLAIVKVCYDRRVKLEQDIVSHDDSYVEKKECQLKTRCYFQARVLIISFVLLIVGGCRSAEVRKGKCSQAETITYTSKDGRIEIKPRLKYELILSIHVLQTAEDHHRLFVPWAEQMRRDLSAETLKDARFLGRKVHEWGLCSLVADYDGPDNIECLTDYIEHENRNTINRWARWLILEPKFWFKGFASWYADFLRRYYREGFGKSWLAEHRQLVHNDAKSVSTELENLEFSIPGFMEEHTGRRFSDNTKTIYYPSSFSRPCHAYGFSENGKKVALYQIGNGLEGLVLDAFHELMHGLIRGWQKAGRMRKPIAELGKEPAFKGFAKKGSYRYPDGWVEEIIVHSVANYFRYKAGFRSEQWIRKHQASYGPYEAAFYDAIFDAYDRFDTIDDFIFYAMTHIEATGDSNKPFVYRSSAQREDAFDISNNREESFGSPTHQPDEPEKETSPISALSDVSLLLETDSVRFLLRGIVM